jgi:sarcosine oxidase, subunit gamma
MAKPTADRQSALAGLVLFNLSGMVELTAADIASRFVFRGSADALRDALGFALPTTPLRAAGDGTRAALWLGPDEWLLIGVAAEFRNMPHDLQAELSTGAVCLVDVGHRTAGLYLTGPRAADVLACGCPLDFALAAFPVGMCTRTIFGKCEVIVWRLADARFYLEAGRSFAPYLVSFLREAVNGMPVEDSFA